MVDERGRIVEGRRYRHNEPGIRALCARLVRLQVALVAVERPDGAVDSASGALTQLADRAHPLA